MKKLLSLVSSLLLFSSCSFVQKQIEVEIDPELTQFMKSTNLVFSDDFFWIKTLPGSSFEIGSIYEKQTRTIGGKEFTIYRFVTDEFFGPLKAENIKQDDQFRFLNHYTFKSSNASQLEALSVFSSGYSGVTEIKKAVELSRLVGLSNAGGLTPQERFCKGSYYVVTRAYYGAASDFGLNEVSFQAKLVGVDFGPALSGYQHESMHVVKNGALAYVLEPANSFCGMSTHNHKIIESAEDLRAEIEEHGFKMLPQVNGTP